MNSADLQMYARHDASTVNLFGAITKRVKFRQFHLEQYEVDYIYDVTETRGPMSLVDMEMQAKMMQTLLSTADLERL